MLSGTTEDGKSGSDVAAIELRAGLERNLHLPPLFIPAKEPETVETAIAMDANSVHPGDRMVIDSDKPYWTPTISITISPSVPQPTSASHFSSIAPSAVSSTGTLVDTASLRSTTTGRMSCDLYGWEEGLEQKLTLEAQVGQEIPRRRKSLISKVWGTLSPRPH
jgi:hypothetical protein